MSNIDVSAWFVGVSVIELVAVSLFVLYLVLAIRQQILCWLAAFIASILSIAVFAEAELSMQASLQVFYAAMAIYGWYQWRGGNQDSQLKISIWPLRVHAAVVIGVVVVSIVTTYILQYLQQPTSYLDSLTAVGAVVATWMVTRKILENWVYWVVIDLMSGYLYFSRGLMLYFLLNFIYLVLVVFGFREWFKDWRAQPSARGHVA